MTQTSTISVTGYFEGGCCMHCGRELRHCVQTDAGTFGAACFSNTITKPLSHRGKSYRLTTSALIDLAKKARNPARFGLYSHNLEFEAA